MRVWSVPMRTRFRGITVREGVLVPGSLPSGETGWGEWSPFLEYPPEVAEPWLRCAEEAAAGDWPAPLRASVPVNVTVPAVDPERAFEIVRAGGCTTAKVKVAEPGQTLADDQARLEAVRAALGPGGRIRVDANGGWSVAEAVAAIRLLDRAAGGLEYAEQPCAAVEDLALVRRAVEDVTSRDPAASRCARPAPRPAGPPRRPSGRGRRRAGRGRPRRPREWPPAACRRRAATARPQRRR